MPKVGEVIRSPVSKWETRNIQVYAGEGKKPPKIEAMCYGQIAVNKNYFYKDTESSHIYCVTHIPTGMWMTKLPNKEDCLKIGEYLWENFALILCNKDNEVIKAKMPGWVIKWVYRCQAKKKWLDPELSKE